MPNNTDNSDGSKYIRDTPLAEEAKKALQNAEEDIFGPVTISKYNSWRKAHSTDHPTNAQIANRIGDGNWTTACQVAGVKHKSMSGCSYTSKELKTALTQAVGEIGEPLSVEEYRNYQSEESKDLPSANVIKSGFGGVTWEQACRNAGIQSGGGYTSTDIRNALLAAATELNKPLTRKEYQSYRQRKDSELPSATTIQTRLGDGSWKDACKSVDVTPGTIGTHDGDAEYTTDELQSALTQAVNKMGEPLFGRDHRQWRQNHDTEQPSVATIVSYLSDGSWVSACESVGIQTGKGVGNGYGYHYTSDELTTALTQAANTKGEPLTTDEYVAWRKMTNTDAPSVTTILRRSDDGCWQTACQSAGVETPDNTSIPDSHSD